MTKATLFPIMNDTEILNHLADSKVIGIALDIDETLSWTIGHWLQIMQELFGNPEGLTVHEMANKYHLAQNVPYWQGREDVDEWMKHHRASNEVQEILPVIENSKETVLKIIEKIPVVAYLTVRPQCVLSGTQNWLAANGFPAAPIVGKPDGECDIYCQFTTNIKIEFKEFFIIFLWL